MDKKSYLKNREKVLAHKKQFYLDNILRIKEYRKNFREKNKERISEWNKNSYYRHKESRNKKMAIYFVNRYNKNINFRLSEILRKRLRMAIKIGSKAGSAVKDLGCSIEDFKNYLEGKFEEGMNWNNWGIKGWHIDHIKPLAHFDLSNRQQFLIACHYTNLQPLWALENIIKKDKENGEKSKF